ncbi:RrF2 family transcriptional regulator [Nitrospina gracilis]|uniref:RrF2 family transcriptional regulator n=1 Tax=Nitrospina gracilis TaxID=35801 RepID=UPI001F2AF7F3|nr:Rrf2 family transcriptional regulator [Nitrospina gracilis]MCF8719887.1 Rrf2 family protein [Nitrospina gracilis Nb-211]
MKISSTVEWAIHCCTVLAGLPRDLHLTGKDLAEFHDVPHPYLAKALQTLSSDGILKTVPGPNGGYQLARPPHTISLLDIVLSIEGSDSCFECDEIRRRGPSALTQSASYNRPCLIASAMWNAEKVWRRELDKVKLSNLVDQVNAEADPKQLQKGKEWIEGRKFKKPRQA